MCLMLFGGACVGFVACGVNCRQKWFLEYLLFKEENDSTKPKQLQKLNRSKRGSVIIVLKNECVRKRGFLVIKGTCC